MSKVPQLVVKHVKLIEVYESVGAAVLPLTELSTYEEYVIFSYVGRIIQVNGSD